MLEKSKDPWGDFLEDLGFYNPLTKKISLKTERIKYWLSQGVQPTATVHNLLVNQDIIKGRKMKAAKNRKEEEKPKEKSQGPAAEEKPKEEAKKE